MHIDAVLIVRGLIFEIVGEAEHGRELMPGLWVEVGVTAAAIDRTVADANVRQTRRVVGPDRDVSCDVSIASPPARCWCGHRCPSGRPPPGRPGVHKLAKQFGVGSGTIQRIAKAEYDAFAR
jgi:hypothetical protein